ncbi:MAG: hypothetical protein AAGH38_00125 [Pseudomonadota bacterium]
MATWRWRVRYGVAIKTGSIPNVLSSSTEWAQQRTWRNATAGPGAATDWSARLRVATGVMFDRSPVLGPSQQASIIAHGRMLYISTRFTLKLLKALRPSGR